jgi:hypothetical protein
MFIFFPLLLTNIFVCYFGYQEPLPRVQHYYMKRELGKFMLVAHMVFSGIAVGSIQFY